jgi:signal transduction histidine kinase
MFGMACNKHKKPSARRTLKRGRVVQVPRDYVTKQDLKAMEKRIMATQAEILADLKASIVSLKQVNEDTKDAQKSIDELKAKIVELEALIQAGGAITPEIVEAVAEVKTLAQSADDNLPNRVVVPTV